MDAGDLLLYFVYVFSSIFVIVNPVEATMVYVTLTLGLNPQEKSHIYKRATLVACSASSASLPTASPWLEESSSSWWRWICSEGSTSRRR